MTVIDLSESVDIRKAFSNFPSGVAAISAVVDGVPKGLAASSFTVGVSLEPPLVSFAVQNSSTTWPILRKAERIGVSILGINQESVCRQLASKNPNKFDDIYYTATELGAIRIPGCTLWLDCSLYGEFPAGDHAVALLEVHDADFQMLESPLVFHESKFKGLEAANVP
ncbi:flavin reductase family protein [Arthrobacter sp. CDRTa11]|nr:flavin reductase family protein [Arthrobacter sp. CDRTa11]